MQYRSHRTDILMNARNVTGALLIGAVLAGACTGGEEPDNAAWSDTVPAPAQPMEGMDGMAGMQSSAMMTQMSSHMDRCGLWARTA